MNIFRVIAMCPTILCSSRIIRFSVVEVILSLVINLINVYSVRGIMKNILTYIILFNF